MIIASILKMTKQPKRIPNEVIANLRMGKRLVETATTVWGKGAYIAYINDAWSQNDHPLIFPVLRDLATRWANILNLKVITHGDIPTHTALRVSNHVSWLDLVVLTTLLPSKLISKAEVQDYPVIGKILKAASFLYVKRGETDALTVGKQIAEAVKNDRSVMFFPEATTHAGDRVYKVHGKLFIGSILSGYPIQPFIIIYQGLDGQLDKAIPWYAHESLVSPFMRIYKHKQPIAHVIAGKAIDPQGHTLESITVAVKESMDAAYSQLHQEVFGCDVVPIL